MDKVLYHVVIELVKVQWRNHNIWEATWEFKEDMREKHSHLFQDSNMSSLENFIKKERIWHPKPNLGVKT